MKQKITVTALLILCLAFLAYIGYFATRPTAEPAKPPELPENVELTGVIRTSGLMAEDKKELTIAEDQGKYQLLVGTEGTERYFILAPDVEIAGMVGKCVLLTVTKANIGQPGSRLNQNVAYEFPKTVLLDEGSKLSVQDFSACKPYSDVTGFFRNEDFRMLTGTLQRETRPAEDIGYDYTLYVPQGFTEPQNASGIPDIQWHTAVILPGNNSVWKDFELYMGQEVAVEGYSEWGYAETRHYIITKVTPK